MAAHGIVVLHRNAKALSRGLRFHVSVGFNIRVNLHDSYNLEFELKLIGKISLLAWAPNR